MTVSRRYTSADLEKIEPREGWRYEIIGGELHVTSAPSWQHQYVIGGIGDALRRWSSGARTSLAMSNPGVIFNTGIYTPTPYRSAFHSKGPGGGGSSKSV